MLQDIRNSSQSTAAKVIVGLIIVTFALFGVESIVGSLGGEPEVATVNGEEISEAKFERALESRRRQIISQMGERADPDLIDEGLLRTSVLEGMIQEEILVQDATSKGLFVSDQAVDSYIRNVEQFNVDGTFSNDRMQILLRNAGLTMKDYRSGLKRQFVLGQSQAGIVSSAFLLESEGKELIALDRQQRSFGVVTAPKTDYLDAVTVTDAEVESHYEENKSSYKKPENVDVSFIEIKRDSLADSVEVTEESLLALYEDEKSEFEGEEERQAAHILIKIDDDRSEEQALEEINKIAEQVRAGEAFDQLAKAVSEDEGSSSEGGDLGLTGKGVYVSDFEDALYALEEGQVSEPVKTEFGYHLIKLLAIETNEIPSFDEMKPGLAQRLKDQRAQELYAELTERLADLSYSSPDLAEPADELDLPVKELAGVAANSNDPVFSSIKVQRVLFSDELVKEENNSELIEVEEGHAVVFRVNAYNEESILSLDKVKEEVRAALVDQKAEQYAESVGNAYISRVSAGEAPEIVSEDMGLKWTFHENVQRDAIAVGREVLARAFAIKKSKEDKDNLAGFGTQNGDYAVIFLKDVAEGNLEDVTSVERESIRGMAGRSLGAGDYQNYQTIMERDAEVERI